MINLTFKIPQEKVPDITITFSLEEVQKDDFTVLRLKERIKESHPFKPDTFK